MKKTILILILVTTLSCCNKDDDTPLNPIDQLPQATQIGANTAGCLVNGQAFLPNNQSVQPLVCNYLDGEDFSLGISKKVNNIYYNLLVSIYNTPLQVDQTYPLNTLSSVDSKTGEYVINHESSPSPNYYSTSPTITGELTITHHNFNNAFLSGTFWFDAINSDGEIIEVREGRFDMQY